MLCWFQAGHNKIISDKVGVVIVGYCMGAKTVTRLLRADSKRLIWLSFPARVLGPHGLDWQRDRARTDWSHQSWWLAEAAHETGTLSGFPVPQLVGTLVQGLAWTYVILFAYHVEPD